MEIGAARIQTSAPLSRSEMILRLQRTAGNRAVGRRLAARKRMLARKGTVTAADQHLQDALDAKRYSDALQILASEFGPEPLKEVSLTTEELTGLRQVCPPDHPLRAALDAAEAERIKHLESDYAAAVAANDWNTAARLLNGFDRPQIEARIAVLTDAQRKQLEAGALRAMPGFAERLVTLIRATRPTAKPGQAFGKVYFMQVSKDGDRSGPSWKNYESRVDITFDPDPDLVVADEIGFIQIVRVTDNASGAERDEVEGHEDRITPDKWTVDRKKGNKYAWYGVDVNGNEDNNYQHGDSKKPARFNDKPLWNRWNVTWEFETVIACRKGRDAGLAYAAVHWGFKVDNDLKVTDLDWRVEDKPDAAFTTALGYWNKQAGSMVKREKGQEAMGPLH